MGVSLLDLILAVRPCVPGRRSISRVCSKVAYLCGLVIFTTGLLGWVDRSKFSAFLTFSVDCIGIVGNLVVAVGNCLNTVNVVVVANFFRVFLGMVFLPFELTSLVLLVTWFFLVVASLFGFSWVLLCDLLRRWFKCSSSGKFRSFSSNSFSRCDAVFSYVPISKRASLVDFFRCGGVLACLICSMVV